MLVTIILPSPCTLIQVKRFLHVKTKGTIFFANINQNITVWIGRASGRSNGGLMVPTGDTNDSHIQIAVTSHHITA